MNLTFHPIVTAIIAVAPAAFAYVLGRTLIANLDDPALPERLLGVQRRNGSIVGVAIGLLLATSPSRLVWALPLLVLSRMLAAYSQRKLLHSETWSVWAYLSFYVRLLIAAAGFWIFVAAAPALAAGAGTRDWIAALALGAIAVVWNARYVRIFRALVGARPVDAPAIRSRFAQLTEQCGLPGIVLEQVDMRGGSFTNAVALPSIRNPAVVVTDTLLARLDEDEATAILAHEVAHHEQFVPARLKQARMSTWVLIGVVVVLAPMVRITGLPRIVFLFWAIAIMFGLMLQLQRRQKHETESDLRAVALTRDPEALVRALTKLHAFARIPRRWDADLERRATHPSLARRIQAIRRASGAASPEMAETATFAGGDGVAFITFHSDRLVWQDAASITHAIPYPSLRELRIDVPRSRTPELVAVDATARRWTIPLQAGDIARLQSVLDVVDWHVGKSDARALGLIDSKRPVALVVILVSIAIGQVAVLVAGVMALIQPASPVAAAAGVSALVAAGLAARDLNLSELSGFNGWLPVMLGLGGAALIATAVASRHDTYRGVAPRKMVTALALSAALSWMIMPMFGTSAIAFHRNAREWPVVAILTLACAGAFAFRRSRTAQWASLVLVFAGTAAAYGGSTDFVDRFVSDPFVARVPPVEVQMQTTSPLSEFAVDFYPSMLRLSPSGMYVALATYDAQDETNIHAGRAGASLTEHNADDAAFLSESELLLFERESRESVLRLVDLSDSRAVWTVRVPVRGADFAIDRSSRRWRLLGHTADGDVVSAEGQVGSQDVFQVRWETPDGIDDVEPLAVSGGHVIALETRYGGDGAEILRMLPWPAFWSLGRPASSLWRLSNQGSAEFALSNAELRCQPSPAFDQPSICAAFDGSRTRFFTLNPETRALVPHGSILGHMYVAGTDEGGWLHGWWDGTALAVQPATGTAIRFRDHESEHPFQAAVGQSVVGSIFFEDGESIIRIHQIR